MSFQNEGPTDMYAQVHKPSKEQQPKQTVTTYVAIYVQYICTSIATYVHTYDY